MVARHLKSAIRRRTLYNWWRGDWSPSDLGSKLKLWLDAKDNNLVLLKSTSNDVAAWLDKSDLRNTITDFDVTFETPNSSDVVVTESEVGGNLSKVITVNENDSTHYVVAGAGFILKDIPIKWDFWIYIPSSNIVVIDKITIRHDGWQHAIFSNIGYDTWVNIVFTGTPTTNVSPAIRLESASGDSFLGNGTDYIALRKDDFKLINYNFGNIFVQSVFSAMPLYNGTNKITFDGVGEFSDGSNKLSVYTALGSGLISWVAQVNSENRLGAFVLGNSADDTERFQVGVDSNNKIYYRCQAGANDDILISTNTVADGDICQVRSTGSAIEIYKNGVLETIIISSGANSSGRWFDAPTVDSVTIGAILKISTTYYKEESQSILITTGETDDNIVNIYNHLSSRF